MVLIDDKKYACETCIKGHRSSSCKHTDRPLFEIKKKGRPVTQCEHCRELRKTKQVHVKCLCESKEESVEPCASPSSRKGGNKMPQTAIFPNGLPEDLEASVALQLLSEGLSDSDRGEQVSSNTCSCKGRGPCECFTPRKSAPRRRKTGDRPSDERDSRSLPSEVKRNNIMLAHSSSPSSQVLARIAELRPVLPRPPIPPVNLVGSSHNALSDVAHGHSMRHYTRDNLFSPYGRAYDMSHGLDRVYGRNNASEQGSAYDLPQDNQKFSRSAITDDHAFSGMPMRAESWVSNGEPLPSACSCGGGCTCPGCIEYSGGRILGANTSPFSMCANPGACSHCLNCTALSLPTSIPPDTALSIYDSAQSQFIDEWIRQISTSSTSSSSRPLLPDLPTAQTHSSSWEHHRTPPLSEPPHYSPPSECCGGRCKCPSGFCTCTGDCCGCCQGCVCADHEHHGDILTNAGGLTFSTSRERQICCLGARRQGGRSSESFEGHRSGSRVNLPQTSSSAVCMSVAYSSYLDIPGMGRSRSSSSSSSQSGSSSVCTNLSTMYATPRPNPLRGLPPSDSPLSPTSPRPTYATSVGDSEISSDDQQFDTYSQYNPSLGGMQMY